MRERYSVVYSIDDEYTLKQANHEADEQFIIMERSLDDLLECERDEVQKKVADLYSEDYDL